MGSTARGGDQARAAGLGNGHRPHPDPLEGARWATLRTGAAMLPAGDRPPCDERMQRTPMLRCHARTAAVFAFAHGARAGVG